MIYKKSYYSLTFEEMKNIKDDYYVFNVHSGGERYDDIKTNIEKIDKDLTKTSSKNIQIYIGTYNNSQIEEIYFCFKKNKQKRRDMRTFYIKLLNKIINRNINN